MKRRLPGFEFVIIIPLFLLFCCTNCGIKAGASDIYTKEAKVKEALMQCSPEQVTYLDESDFKTLYHLNASFNKKKAKKNISVTYKKLPEGILAVYKNKNSYPVSLAASVKFKDADGENIKVSKEHNYCLGAKATCLMFFSAPYDGNGNNIGYSSYKSSFSVTKANYKSYRDKININWDIQTMFSNFSATNASGKELMSIHISILFYDANGDLLGYRGKSLNCYAKDSTSIFSIEHSSNWGGPAKLKVYVDYAY